ncbi:CHAT domain-containing protein [Rhizobium sp. BK176]|uniref:CHAT domain-containing protein n=1 Tax=Rhizobium sp. BK176 TaxID=2587071 RepID=UPI002168E2E6|nr:CHAT domain-containing protein [Rhizobium sp. BK176]MCS4096117.1 CHAT domain-containing protein/TPR repeat protein [Rhizobium sp. BK176]
MVSLFSFKRASHVFRIILISRVPLAIFLLGVLLVSEAKPGVDRPTGAMTAQVGAFPIPNEHEFDEIVPSRPPKKHIGRSRQPTLRTMIANSGCFGRDEIDPDYELDLEVAIAASWQGVSKDQLEKQAGLSGDERYLQVGMAKMLAKANRGVRQFNHDLHTFGKDVCPLLRFEWSSLHEHSDRPYFKAAQTALFVAGCAGNFDKYSRTEALRSWNAIAKINPSVRFNVADGIPLPSDVVALIRNLRNVACDPKRNGFDLDIRPFEWLASTLEYRCDRRQAENLETVVRIVARPNAGRALMQRAMLLVWKSIETSKLIDGNGRLASDCSLPATFTEALLDLFDAKNTSGSAAFGADIFSNAGRAAEVYFGTRFLFGVGVRTDVEIGAALLAKAGAREELKSALAAGILNRLPRRIAAAEASSEPRLYEDYATFLEGGSSASRVARSYIRELKGIEGTASSSIDLSYDELIPVIRLAHLAAKSPSVAEMIMQEGDAALNYAISIILIEGQSEAGRNLKKGMEFLQIAARRGLPEAKFRLAVAREYGLGGGRDQAEAIRLYEEAANGKHAAALYALARIYEDGAGVSRDLTKAAVWYTRATQDRYFDPTPLVHRVMEGGAFLRSGPGKTFLEGLAARQDRIAKQLGDAFTCIECGGVVDLEEAVSWYRLAVSQEEDSAAAYSLLRILMARPDLAQGPDEPLNMLGWLRGSGFISSDIFNGLFLEVLELIGQFRSEHPERAKEDVKQRLRKFCIDRRSPSDGGREFGESDPSECLLLLHTLALGGFGSPYASLGFELLHDFANKTDKWKPKAAFADVLAFYGDFESASLWFGQAAESQPEDIYEDRSNAYSAGRTILVRAVVNQITKKGIPSGDVIALLRTLVKLGDHSAASLLTIANGPSDVDFSQLGVVNGTLQDLIQLYNSQVERGGISLGLVERARSLAAAYFVAGDHKQALRYELIGLQTERQLLATESIANGPISAALADVCTLSKSSQRVAKYGYSDAAIVLAKVAVNRLQGVRRDIAGLPEHLQLCFRDVVGGYYRSLADLFIEQKRDAEAEFVMSLRDDFERFQFLAQDEDYVGNSFLEMPFTEDEERIRSAIGAVSPPSTLQAKQYVALQAKQIQHTLSPAEDKQLVVLSEALVKEGEKVQQIVEEISSYTHSSEDSIRQELSGMQSRISIELGGDAVAIRYVILPAKIDAILITADTYKSFTWQSIDGKPFSEAALDEKITSFRNALKNPMADPRVLGNDLYNIIFKPLRKEIEAIGAKRLLVSSDRRLHGIPFGALYDGTHYLIEDFVITEVSGVNVAGASKSPNLSKVNFLGVSEAVGGFPALPSVIAERDSIVRNGTKGVLPGVAIMDNSFTVEALKSALIFMNGDRHQLGIVHIASHFEIGTKDSDSFLLLGNGKLTVEQLKKGINQFRFSDVGLLTLSACDTATTVEQGDGSGLKSLASVAQRESARAVLASLWPIRDASTAAFMGRFYQIETSEGLDHATSLARVMREFIHDHGGLRGLAISGDSGIFPGYSHPIYWAPFVLLEGY